MGAIAFILGVICFLNLQKLLNRTFGDLNKKALTESEFLQSHPDKKWVVWVFSSLWLGMFVGIIVLLAPHFFRPRDRTQQWLNIFWFPMWVLESQEVIVAIFEIFVGWSITVKFGGSVSPGRSTFYRTIPNIRNLGLIRFGIVVFSVAFSWASFAASSLFR